jgi:septum site-determining protein MinC
MMQNLIKIKGGREGLRMQLDEAAAWPALLAAVQVQLEQGGGFFAGSQLTLDIGERVLEEAHLTELLALLEQHGVQLTGLATAAQASRKHARALGLTTRSASRATPTAEQVSQSPDDALLVVRTLRSGQVVRHHGHVTIVGDINPGAEVIAGGSVIVWGRLRGLVHAGALGDAKALICALELRPTQLRIAHLIARTPDGGSDLRETRVQPEVARIEQDYISVETWGVPRRTRI